MPKTIPISQWYWLGFPGHFIGAAHCRFHLTTIVGKYVISTVGDWWPMEAIPSPIAAGDTLYETMVFKYRALCDCGCGMPIIVPKELASKRCTLPQEATANHMALCLKYAYADKQAE